MFRGASGSYLPAYAISDNNVPHTESWFSLEEWTGNEEPVVGEWGTKGSKFIANDLFLSLGQNQSLCFSLCLSVFLIRLLVR